jgi:hypothetical protein
MNNVIEDMSRDEAATYFLGNPGSGIAADFPKAKRDYDAGTISFTKLFADQWLASVSYTLSYLRGNYAGLFRPESGQLDPNINSDFDLISLLDNRDGPLAGDSTHSIKIFGAKDFTFFKTWDLNIGLGFRAASGNPTNFVGSHAIYGANEVFILPRGCGDRLPWNFSIDPHIGFGYRLAKDSVVTLSMDIFNVFNFQAADRIDSNYTAVDVLPLSNPDITKLCEEGATKEQKAAAIDANLKRSDTTTAFDPTSEKNPNFGNPNRYQPPRTFRFGAKVTF